MDDPGQPRRRLFLVSAPGRFAQRCFADPERAGSRLCPLNSDLNEDCFNEHPVKMVGQSKLRWGGVGGRELAFDAVTVTKGTKAGVMWRKNPVPRAWKTKDGQWGHGSNHGQTGVGFQPVRSQPLAPCTRGVLAPQPTHCTRPIESASRPAARPSHQRYRLLQLESVLGCLQVCDDEGMDQKGTEQSCTGEWGPYNMEIGKHGRCVSFVSAPRQSR